MKKIYNIKLTPTLSIDLPLIKTDNISYYSFNMLGMAKWNQEIAKILYDKISMILKNETPDVIVTVESKAIGLAEQLSRLYNIEKYIVIRKTKKSYMNNPITINNSTIISGKSTYWIDEVDLNYLRDKKVIICDDVISTGGTVHAILDLIKSIECKPLLLCCALTEGIEWTEYTGIKVVSCAHLPLPINENSVEYNND